MKAQPLCPVTMADLCATIISIFRVSAEQKQRQRIAREIIRHNVRCYLARRHGAQVVLTVPGYFGTPINLTRSQCDQLRRGAL